MTLALAAAAAAGNYFAFNLFQNIDFLFGSIAALVASRLYGIRSGCVVAFVGGIVTFYDWGHPYAIIILTLEVAVVGLLARRVENLVIADALYWLFVGFGSVTLFYNVFLGLSLETAIYIALKQTVNGVFNAVFAASILEIGRFYIPAVQQRLPTVSFRTVLFYFAALVVMVASTAFVLVQAQSTYNRAVASVNSLMMFVASWADEELEQTGGNEELLRGKAENRVSQAIANLNMMNIPVSAVSIGIAYPNGDVSTIVGELRSPSQDGRLVIDRQGISRWEPAEEMPDMLRAGEMVYLVKMESRMAPLEREILLEVSAVPLTELMEAASRRGLVLLAVILAMVLGFSRMLTHGFARNINRFIWLSQEHTQEILAGRPPKKFSSSGITELDDISALMHQISQRLADSFLEQRELNATLEDRVKQRTQELDLLSQVAKQTTNAVIVTDRNGKVTWINDACTEISGYSLAEMRGMSPGEVLQKVPPPDEILEDMRYAIANKKKFHHEVMNHSKDGNPYWIEIRCNPIFDSQLNHTGFIAIENDVTERRKTYRELQNYLAQLQLAASIAEMGIWSYDNATQNVDWNDMNYILHGIPRSASNAYEIWESAVHPDDLMAMKPLLIGLGSDLQKVVEFEYRYTHPELGERLFLSRAQVIYINAEGHRRYTGTNLDVTESRRLQKRLEQSVEKTIAILENAHDSIITIDNAGVIISFNRAAENLFGHSAGEVIGKNVTTLMPANYAKHHSDYISTYLKGREASKINRVTQLDALRANGDVFPMEIAVSETKDDTDVIFIGIVRDLTERNKIDRMKSELVATVSHELRTPLTSVSGALALLKGGVAGKMSEQGIELLDAAIRNSQRLTRLIEDLLDIETLSSDRMTFNYATHSIDVLLKQALEANVHYAERSGISLELKKPLPDVSIRVDEVRFVQIISNFLSNAVKFSPPGERVAIEATFVDDEVICSVTDSGPGIPEEFRERLFQRFAQVDSSDTRSTSGTGLGLAISKQLAVNMNGSVSYEPATGGGARFWVRFPIVSKNMKDT